MTFQLLGAALLIAAGVNAQSGKWAAASDPVAKSLIQMEREWAEAACTHSPIEQKLLADDFVGTSPEGKLYTKAEAVEESKVTPANARECRLKEAKVRLFGDNAAVVFGSESAIHKSPDGKESPRCLIWTDTFLKRDGKWQIIAAQDMPAPCE